jgi:hypothetical protein
LAARRKSIVFAGRAGRGASDERWRVGWRLLRIASGERLAR